MTSQHIVALDICAEENKKLRRHLEEYDAAITALSYCWIAGPTVPDLRERIAELVRLMEKREEEK